MQKKQKAILVAVKAVMKRWKKSLRAELERREFDTRDGQWDNDYSISWIRGLDTNPTVKVNKKGHLFVAQKFSKMVTFTIDPSNCVLIINAVLQINVTKANGKRGGWLIHLYKQTPVMSNLNKFVFSGVWHTYWATDEMLRAGMVCRAIRGKFGKSVKIYGMEKNNAKDVYQAKDVYWHRYTVKENIDLLSRELGIKSPFQHQAGQSIHYIWHAPVPLSYQDDGSF